MPGKRLEKIKGGAPMPGLSARIKALAELEGPCLAVHSVIDNACGEHLCGGTGRIVLFKALRVSCPGHQPVRLGQRPRHHEGCFTGCICSGPGWAPELDVEKAYWRLLKVIGPGELTLSWDTVGRVSCYVDITHPPRDSHSTLEEAVISAAEAWAEQMKVA